MLTRFTVENFLCFGARTCLDLESSPPSSVAFLVGDNGAGKSALQQALSCVRNLVLAGSRPGQALPITPNLLSPSGPSRFELSVRQDGALWSYGFSATTKQIEEEWLTRDSGDGPLPLFFRRGTNTPLAIELGPELASDRKRLDLVAYGTRPEQLFLNEALRRGVTTFVPLAMWLRDRLQLVLSETKVVGLAARAAREPAFAEFLGQLLAEAGAGVVQIEARREALHHDTFESEDEERELVAALTSFPDAFAETPDGELIAEQDGRVVDLYRVRLVCTIADKEARAELPVSALGEGFQRLLHLAPLLHTRVAEPIFFVDDLDRSLTPPHLTRLLSRFLARGAEAGQLIATLHDDAPLNATSPPIRTFQMERTGGACVTIRAR